MHHLIGRTKYLLLFISSPNNIIFNIQLFIKISCMSIVHIHIHKKFFELRDIFLKLLIDRGKKHKVAKVYRG